MQVTASPSSMSQSGSGVSWTNLSNAMAADSSYAVCVLASTPYALQFDDGSGTNGNSVVSADTGLPTGGSARTIAFWLKFPTGSTTDFATGAAFRYGYADPVSVNVGQGYGCYLVVASGGSPDFLFGSTTIPANDTWHYILVTCDGSNGWAIYVDNALDTSGTIATGTDTGGDCSIGANGTLYSGNLVGGDFVNGIIDDVRVYGFAADSTQRSTLYNSGNGRTDDPFSNVLRWYKFSEGTGTSVADSGANGVAGTLYAGTGKALNFGEPTEYFYPTVNSDGAGLPTGGDAVSICWWFKTSNVYAGFFINEGAFPYVAAGLNAGYLKFSCVFDTPAVTTPETWNDNSWHHAACVWDGTHMIIYVDGTLRVQTTPGTALNAPSGSTLKIGQSPWGGVTLGLIDDFRLFGSALTSGQITTLYNSGNGTASPLGGELRWYKFDEGTGTTAADSGSNGKDGTLNGGPLPTWATGKVPYSSVPTWVTGKV